MPYAIELKRIVITLFLLTGTLVCAQNFTVKLNGNVYVNEGNVFDIHVINITSKKITATDRYGHFAILAKLNDTLVFSSIQFKEKRVVVNEGVYVGKPLHVWLEKLTTELDEIVVKPYNLSGWLGNDVKDTVSLVNASTLKLPNANVKLRTQHERKLYTARTWDFTGFSVKLDPLINAISGRTLMLKNKVALELKSSKYMEVYESIDDSLVVSELKIPKERVYDFYFYCEVDKSFDSIVNLNIKGDVWKFMVNKSTDYRKNNKL